MLRLGPELLDHAPEWRRAFVIDNPPTIDALKLVVNRDFVLDDGRHVRPGNPL